MASSQYYTDLKTAFAYDVEAARPMPTVPSKLNAQAHLMYFGAEADTMDDDEELVLGKEPSFLRDMNSSCLCFNKPCGILGTLLFSAIISVLLFFSTSSGNSPLNSVQGSSSRFDAPSSLGCENAPHFFQNVTKVTYSIPLDEARKLSLRMMGDAVGTLTIVSDDHPTANADTALIELTVRTSDESLLDSIYVHEEIEKGNVWRLFTPDALDSSDADDETNNAACMRYDVVLHVPAGLDKLRVVSHTTTQVRFSGPAVPTESLPQRMLSSLYVSLRSPSYFNHFASSHSALSARRMALQMSGGAVTGSVGLGELLHLDTQQGNVITDLDVVQLPTSLLQNSDKPATLRTTAGQGLTSLRVIRPSASSYAPMTSEHLELATRSNAVIDYTKAAFGGIVNLEGAYAGQLNEVDFFRLNNDEAFSAAGVSTRGKDRLQVTSVDSTWMEMHI